MKRERNSFLTPLAVEVLPDGKTFKLVRPFTYVWREHTTYGMTIRVPVGFITDFASIPRFARVIIPKLGKYTKAAVVHDYLCRNAESWTLRRLGDRIFRDAMKDLGVVKWKRTLMWLAVLVAGWIEWRFR